jgi:hypothetical protein
MKKSYGMIAVLLFLLPITGLAASSNWDVMIWDQDAWYSDNIDLIPIDPISQSHTKNICRNDNTIEISWSDPNISDREIKGYAVLWDTAPDTLPEKIISTSNKSHISQPLTDGNYYVHIRIVDSDDVWNNKALHDGPYCIKEVSIPTGLKISEINVNHCELKWDSSGYNLTYNVYRSDSENGFYIKCDPYGLADTEFLDTDTTIGQQYWYKVTALNALGEESLFSRPVSAQIDPQAGGGYQLFSPQPHQMQLSGLSATYQLRVFPFGGYAGFVDLYVSNLPSWMEATFNQNPAELPCFTTLTVNITDIVEQGKYKFYVSAIGENSLETIDLFLDVKELSSKESAISAYTRRSQIYLHESIDIFGNIIPRGINTPVTIHIQHESDKYPTIINTTTDENRSYISTYIPEKTGRYVIFSRWDGDTIFDSAESTHLILTVLRGESKVTCRTPDEDISSDKMVHINGQLQMPSIGDAHIVLLKKFIINESDYELERIENRIFTGPDGSYSYSIKLEREGLWEITACWEGNETYSGGISNPLRLYPGLKAGKALIVAGGGILSSNTLWETTQYLTTKFYKLLLDRKYPKELIHYISPDTGHNNNQIVINDNTPTVSDIENYIESLYIDTSQQYVNSERPFILYLADHGGDQTFKVNDGLEILKASDLDNWLDDLQTHTGCSVYNFRSLLFWHFCGHSGTN